MNRFLILASACVICSGAPASAAPDKNEHRRSASTAPHNEVSGRTFRSRQEARPELQRGRQHPARPDQNVGRDASRQADHSRDGDSRRQPLRKWSNPNETRRFFVNYDQHRNRGAANFCPPGLAKRNNRCLPPGQAMRLYRSDDRWGRYMAVDPRYRTGNWFYYDGYAYSSSRGMNFIPLVGGALFIGTLWPRAYDSYSVPDYYSNYYGYDNDYQYYYADRTIFGVNPETQAIMGIAALLTGNDINVGRPMPTGYDVYNVPYAYRDRYHDSVREHYRYSDGYIYRIDPTTRLVAAVIELVL